MKERLFWNMVLLKIWQVVGFHYVTNHLLRQSFDYAITALIGFLTLF